jgi:hypothetical protein
MSEIKTIIVELEKVADEHFLVFKFDDPLRLNLKSSNHDDIRNLFSQLIAHLLDEEFELEFNKETTIAEGLVKEVAEEYVSQLIIDLKSIKKDQGFLKYGEIHKMLD